MKTTAILTAAILASALPAAANQPANVETLDYKSELFPFTRQILIYTPEAYDECTESDYDVIYVFDAQNRSHFDEVQSLMHYGVQEQNDRNYIVVGVASPMMWNEGYIRNNDFLPVPEFQKLESPYYGSADKFKKFLKEELMPYIDSHYRTSGHTLGIGHSLGASFVLDAIATDDLFDDAIAISPNMEYDNYRFARNFMNLDFSDGRPRYIYLTMGNEGMNPEDEFPESWVIGWNKVKDFVATATYPENARIQIHEFPEYNHNKVVLPAHLLTLKDYAAYRYNPMFNDEELHPVHIELTGSSIEGDVFITGNQEALANWNPQGVKMTAVNDTTRVIDLNLRLPAEFKFTKGSWDYAFFIENGDPGNVRITSADKADKHYHTF